MVGQKPLADAIRGLRENRGVSLAEAARRTGLGKSTLHQWESGNRTPRVEPLGLLLDFLEAPDRLRARLIALADPRNARVVLAHHPSGSPVEVGQVLRAMRLRRGLTQAEAARAAGVVQGTFARWEGGGDIPEPETLHAVGFALGASAEETAALSAAQGGAGRTPKDWEAALHLAIDIRWWEESLHEVLQFGLEADAWWRAAHLPQWDVVATSAMAKRAFRYFLDGRFDEADESARWAVRLARSPEARSEAVMALDVVESLARRRGDPTEPVVRLAESWADSIPIEDSPEGGSKVWATKIAARARAAAGDLDGALKRMEPVPDWLARRASGDSRDFMERFEFTDVYLLGNVPERALPFVEWDATRVGRKALYALILRANAQTVPETWRSDLRTAYGTTDIWTRRAIERIEREPEIRELGR